MERFASHSSAPAGLGPIILRCAETGEDPVTLLRTLTPLPPQSERIIDTAVVGVGLQRMAVVEEVMSAGLIYTVPNWLSAMSLEWQRVSRYGTARRVMLPNARGENSLPDQTTAHLPLFCTMQDFSMNVRLLAQSRRVGTPLDTTGIENAVLNVNEAQEDQAINGAAIQAGGYTAPGLLNAPNASSVQYTGGESWAVAGHDGADIKADVMAMVEKAHLNNRRGPYVLFVNSAYDLKLNDDYVTTHANTMTIRARLEEMRFGGKPLKIVVADFLPANYTVLVEMNRDVLDVVVGQQPTAVSWQDPSGWNYTSAVLSCVILRVRDDYESHSGIVIGHTTDLS